MLLSHFLLDISADIYLLDISGAAISFWGSAGSLLGSTQHIWTLILLNGNKKPNSVYWQLNLSKDVQPPPLALKMHSEAVKRKDFCLYICLYICIFCNTIIVLLGVHQALIVFPKEAGKKNVQNHLSICSIFLAQKIKHASIAKLQHWPPCGLLLTHQLLSLSGVHSIWKSSFSVTGFVIKCSPLKMPGYWVGKCEQGRFFLWWIMPFLNV